MKYRAYIHIPFLSCLFDSKFNENMDIIKNIFVYFNKNELRDSIMEKKCFRVFQFRNFPVCFTYLHKYLRSAFMRHLNPWPILLIIARRYSHLWTWFLPQISYFCALSRCYFVTWKNGFRHRWVSIYTCQSVINGLQHKRHYIRSCVLSMWPDRKKIHQGRSYNVRDRRCS